MRRTETKRGLALAAGAVLLLATGCGGGGDKGPTGPGGVERKTGYLVLGKLTARTTAEVIRRAAQVIQRQPHPVRTITTDNGTEFHGYAALEAMIPARFYFATPHHAPAPALRRPRGGGRRHLVPLLQSGPAGPLR